MNPEEKIAKEYLDEEVRALIKDERSKLMGKATFWLFAAIAVIFVLGKISTMNSA
jgi:hypothetical protein